MPTGPWPSCSLRTCPVGRVLASWALTLAGFAALAWQLPALVGDTGTVAAELTALRWHWIWAAVVLGVAALVAYGELHRVVLTAGGSRLRFGTVQAINFVENALSTTLPGVGNAAGFVYATYQLRRNHVGVALAVWSLVLSGAVATVLLFVLGLLGLAWSGQLSRSLAIAAAVLVFLGSWWLWHALGRVSTSVHERVETGVDEAGERGWRNRVFGAVRRLADQARLLHPSKTQWGAILSLAALSWVLDASSLLASVAATGHTVPIAALVAGFLVVQASIALQIFPGGAGPAEAGLFGVLTAFGLPAAAAAAAVLVYRAINWLGLAALGWIMYAAGVSHRPGAGH